MRRLSRMSRPGRPGCEGGFTLPEMLVAIAIFMAITSGLVVLFAGTMRASRTGYQQMDAFDQARGALNVIDRDLRAAFNSRDYTGVESFFGTPLGFTFIGNIQTSETSTDRKVARVTYVIYTAANRDAWASTEATAELVNAYPRTFQPGEEGYDPAHPLRVAPEELWPTGYMYPMLRYVEPGVSNLDAFPVNWDYSNPEFSNLSLNDLIDNAVYDAKSRGLCDSCEAEFRKMKKRELWIRMLAGGDDGLEPGAIADGPVPNAWNDLASQRAILGPMDRDILYDPFTFFIIRNAMSETSPAIYARWPFLGSPFFDYDYAYVSEDMTYRDPATGADFSKKANPWWNSPRSLNWDPRRDWRLPDRRFPSLLCGGDPADWQQIPCCEDPCLPEVVNVDFWMGFESPYPGAPDFKRRFSLSISLNTAYTRKATQ